MTKIYRGQTHDKFTTTGTGTITLEDVPAAAANQGAIGKLGQYAADQDTVTLFLMDLYGNFELVRGTITISGSTVTFSRDTVQNSSNAGSAVNFAAGDKAAMNYMPDNIRTMLPLLNGGQALLTQANQNTTGITAAGAATGASGTAASGSTTAANAAMTIAGHVRYTNPIAGDTTSYVADVTIANGAQILAAQPDFPRRVQIVVTDANSSITACTITIVGVGASGQALTEAFDQSNQGTKTWTTADAYATITSITVSLLAGGAAGDHIKAGPTNALGLPASVTPAPGTFAVHKSDVDGVNETVGTVDATAGTIIPTTTPNGSKSFDFWFKFVITPTQTGHTHTGPSHTHTAGAITVTDPGHTHTLS